MAATAISVDSLPSINPATGETLGYFGRTPAAALPHYFPEAGPAHQVETALLSGTLEPTVWVDVTATIDAGVASLRQHQAYIDGLGREFDPDQFLKDMAGFIGLGAGCEYAMAFHRYPMG